MKSGIAFYPRHANRDDENIAVQILTPEEEMMVLNLTRTVRVKQEA
jgi:hypothetical protein